MTPEQQGRAGLFDGFEAYRTPTDQDYLALLTEGLVVIDTNVLLNLYRYKEQARQDLMSVLRKIDDRLWIPHQVLVEFWRNRESALGDTGVAAKKTSADLERARAGAVDALRGWARRVSLDKDSTKKLQASLDDAFAVLLDEIAKTSGTTVPTDSWDTNQDRVIETLHELLDGKVGPPFDDVEYSKEISEAAKRADLDIPPGFRDKSKPDGDRFAGDYLIWKQILVEARAQKRDVLLVTGDVKDDWWRKHQGQARGPRPELAREIRSFADVRLFMLRPESLLLHASRLLEVPVDDTSARNMEQVEKSTSKASNVDEETILDLAGSLERTRLAESEKHRKRSEIYHSALPLYDDYLRSVGHHGWTVSETPERIGVRNHILTKGKDVAVCGFFAIDSMVRPDSQIYLPQVWADDLVAASAAFREEVTLVTVFDQTIGPDVVAKLVGYGLFPVWNDQRSWQGHELAAAKGLIP
ncbi:PIN domain-containing protein [Actinosynnema sp. NPDC023794]